MLKSLGHIITILINHLKHIPVINMQSLQHLAACHTYTCIYPVSMVEMGGAAVDVRFVKGCRLRCFLTNDAGEADLNEPCHTSSK